MPPGRNSTACTFGAKESSWQSSVWTTSASWWKTSIGHSRVELSRFDAPAIASDHRTAPVNSLGYLRVMFTVDNIDDTLARLSKLGATVVDEVVNYENPCVIAKGFPGCAECPDYICAKLAGRLVVYEDLAARCAHPIPEEDRRRFSAPYENRSRLDDLRS